MKSLTLELNKFSIIKGIVIGLIMGEIVLLLLLSITSVVMTSTGILNNTVLDIILTIICGISSFVTGFTSSKIIKMKGLLSGFAGGLIFFLIIFSAGLIIMDGTITIFTFLKLIACIIFGAAGGILGINKKEKLIK